MLAAWALVEDFSAETVERARVLPSEKLYESVDGEWSFLETQRHLVFATDRWITGPVLGEKDWFHPLGMPNPPLDEVPALGRSTSMPSPPSTKCSQYAAAAWIASPNWSKGINADDLNRQVVSPNGGMVVVMSCLHVVFREEWWHDQYANRDLAVPRRRLKQLQLYALAVERDRHALGREADAWARGAVRGRGGLEVQLFEPDIRVVRVMMKQDELIDSGLACELHRTRTHE